MADASNDEDESVTVSVGKKAAGGFVWALVGFLLIQIGSFGTYTVASHVLGKELGVVGAALTLVFWVDVLLDLGMGAALIYEQEEGRSERVDVAFTVNAMVSTALSIAVFFSATFIDGFARTGNPNIFRIIAVLVLAKGLNQVPDALLKRDLDFKRRARADFTRSLGRFVISVSLLVAGYGPISMVIGVTVAEIAAVSVTWWLTRFRPTFRFDGAIAGEMLKFGAAMFGSRLVGMLWLNGDYFVVVGRFGSKSREFTDYFTAFRLPELVLGSVYNLFSNVAFPAYSAARQAGPEELRNASLKSLRVLCLFGFSAGIGMALVARDFIGVWFPPGFSGAVPVMELLCVAGGFAAIGFASGDLYAAIGKPRLGLYFNLVGAPILIGGFMIAIPHGIVAVALVHLLVIVPYSAFRIYVANRLLGTTWASSLAALRPAAVAVVGMLAFGLPLRLATDEGFMSLIAILVAGAIGALSGIAVGDRVMFAELRSGASKVIAKVR